MKKKFAIIVSLLICFCFILSGCTLFESNLSKYYNQTVVSIEYENGDVLNINKKELVVAFNNYGAQLVNQGYTYEDALNQTITALINQKVLIKDSEGKVSLTNLEKNNVWKESYNSILANLDEYIAEVKEEWDIAIVEEVEEPKKENTGYTAYEPTAEVVYENGQYVIKLIEAPEEEQNVELICNSEDVNVIVTSLYDSLIKKTVAEDGMTDLEVRTTRVYKEALKRFVKLLLASEDGQRLSTVEEEVLKREIKRVYENTLNSKLISKMQEYIAYSTNLSKITVDDVLAKYKAMILESMTKYTVNNKSLSEDMLSGYEKVNYVPNDSYFFVSHILLEFSDQQKAEYDKLESQRNKGYISQAYYEQKLDLLVQQIVAVEKNENGEVVENSNKTAEQVLTEVEVALNSAVTNAEKDQAFKNLLYKYNQDPGALNSEYLYIIGEEDSQMVETFTQASRDLNKNGEYGGISGLVPSEYGVHIIYYAGKVENVFNFANANDVRFDQEDIEILTKTLLNPLHNKTLFDKIYESLSVAESSANESMYINMLKKDLTITKYTKAYKDLLD